MNNIQNPPLSARVIAKKAGIPIRLSRICTMFLL